MKKLIIGLIVCLLVAGACAPAGAPPMPAEERPGEGATGYLPAPAPAIPLPPQEEGLYKEGAADEREEVSPTAPGGGESWASERMVVRMGDISMVVEEVLAAMDQVASLSASVGGYVVSSQRRGEGERTVGSIAIRVPVEKFDFTMSALRKIAIEVTSENSDSKDVTEEYVDLSARLRNLEATEEQLLRLMEKAEKVEDILAVQRELSKTRGEIEQTKGRMQYLERTSATSLIQVHLEQARLDVRFSASTARAKEGEEVHFFPEVAGGFAPYSYEWDFGDGSTSTEEMPAHSYKTADSYTVSLKVTDDRANSDTDTRTDYITVLPGWRIGGAAAGAWHALVGFGHLLVNVAIWIAIFSPVWLIVGGILYWRRRRRRKKRIE
ncbi:MAG: DUF4349 domain-containing protein [Chloroflexota bacterium]|nr:DUF4349 domain-containing protein [Chloroflexota bacterium]